MHKAIISHPCGRKLNILCLELIGCFVLVVFADGTCSRTSLSAFFEVVVELVGPLLKDCVVALGKLNLLVKQIEVGHVLKLLLVADYHHRLLGRIRRGSRGDWSAAPQIAFRRLIILLVIVVVAILRSVYQSSLVFVRQHVALRLLGVNLVLKVIVVCLLRIRAWSV